MRKKPSSVRVFGSAREAARRSVRTGSGSTRRASDLRSSSGRGLILEHELAPRREADTQLAAEA